MYACLCRWQVVDAVPAHLQGQEAQDNDDVIQIGRPSPNQVRASNWEVLPSQGTEAHPVLLQKTLLATMEGSIMYCNHIRKMYLLPSFVEGLGEGLQ